MMWRAMPSYRSSLPIGLSPRYVVSQSGPRAFRAAGYALIGQAPSPLPLTDSRTFGQLSGAVLLAITSGAVVALVLWFHCQAASVLVVLHLACMLICLRFLDHAELGLNRVFAIGATRRRR
jgi:hypothetical protein